MSASIPMCAVCKIPAVQQCAGCKSVYYCSRDHQKKHWKEGHRNNCAAYKIIGETGCEQYLIATRDIKQNEVILKEIPLVVGPQPSTFMLCLGCNRRIQENHDNIYKCTSCKWPLCGKNCENSTFHKDECRILTEQEYSFVFDDKIDEQIDSYSFLSPLRTLLLKSNSKTKFETIITLLNKPNQLINYNKLKNNQFKTNIVPFLKDVLKVNYTEEEIIEAWIIFELNALDIIKDDLTLRALYPLTSLLKYDCVANTKHSIHGDNYQLVLIATVPIAKGEPITISHSEILWGTLARRAHLMEKKYFECTCKLCSDTMELGTCLGAIFCSKCKKTNEESCPKILSTDPLSSTAIWKCEKCDHTIRGRQMVWGNDAIKSEMNKLGKNPLNIEQFLVKYKETLHPKNYHALVAKYALNQIYGNIKGYLMSDLTDTILERKIDICHELLEVIDVLAPGFSTIRGSLLYDLQAAMVVQAKREFSEGKITKTAAQETSTECMVILKEAAEILSTEPDMKEFLQEKLQELVKELDI